MALFTAVNHKITLYMNICITSNYYTLYSILVEIEEQIFTIYFPALH